MKGFLKFLFALLLPTLCTWYASTFDMPVVTWAVLIITLLLVIFVFRSNLLMFAGINIYRSNPSRGIKIMRSAYKTRRLSPSHQLIFAYLVLRNGELDEAETVMTKATIMGKHALKPEEFQAVKLNRALITWKRGDLSQAIVQLEELYAEGYATAGLYGSLGSFYILNKEYDKALELSKEGIKKLPSDLVILDNIGQAYIGLGMLDDALKVYENLIPRKPGFLEAYYNYATILEKRDRLTKAKHNYETALTLDEKFLSTVTHDEVCEALERIGNLSIENVKIEDIVYEGTTAPVEYDSSKELSSIDDVEVDVTISPKEESHNELTEEESPIQENN